MLTRRAMLRFLGMLPGIAALPALARASAPVAEEAPHSVSFMAGADPSDLSDVIWNISPIDSPLTGIVRLQYESPFATISVIEPEFYRRRAMRSSRGAPRFARIGGEMAKKKGGKKGKGGKGPC